MKKSKNILKGSITKNASVKIFKVDVGDILSIANVTDKFVLELNLLAKTIHDIAVQHGFWEKERNDGEAIALMHSELSEALETLRKPNAPSEHIPKYSGLEEELADVIIRILDFAASKKLKLAEAILAKVEYNKGRPYRHGKKF